MLWRSILLLILVLLVGCNKPRTYKYFMTHPKILYSTLMVCKSSEAQNPSQECKTVMLASHDFEKLAFIASQNRLNFGQKILQMEMQLGVDQNEYAQIKEELKQLIINKQTAAIKQIQEILQLKKAHIINLKNQIDYHLAVIKMQGV